MLNAKPVVTPLSASLSLKVEDDVATIDATTYRQLLGALQYLTVTRPDICFTVNKLSQFMQHPSHTH